MLKKLLAGFIVMAIALTGAPVASFAGVEVGDNLKLFGDFRMRFEFDDRSNSGNRLETIAGGAGAGTSTGAITTTNDQRERPRLRARFGVKYQSPWEPVSIGLRLTTSANMNSPHPTLDMTNTGSGVGTGNTGNRIEMDRAFAKLKFLESGALTVGKIPYPYWQQSEQYWDGDISPEGYAAVYAASLQDLGSVTAGVGYFYIVNESFANSFFDNDTLLTWQVNWKGKFDAFSSTLAFSGTHATDGNNDGDYGTPPTGAAAGTAFGNGNLIGAGVATLQDEPDFYNFSGQIVTKAFEPVTILVGGEYLFSTAELTAASAATMTTVGLDGGDDHDTGFVIQGRVKWDQFGVRYYYYDVDEFAMPFHVTAGGAVTYFTQDNLPTSNAGASGFEAHRIQFDWKVAKNINTDFRIYLMEAKEVNYAIGEPVDIDRYQVNFNVKF